MTIAEESKKFHAENRGNCATVINMFYISQPGVPLAVPHTELEGQ